MALDWLLAISCLFSVFVTIIYLFYSNRILAFLIGYVLRLSWWNGESSRAWVYLESFQVSLLAGKIMIKELRYHSSNQTFRAIKCSITWRYWLWRTRRKPIGRAREGENKDAAESLTLPCRVQITLEGVEWLLYNRTASYNDILTKLQQHATQDADARSGYIPSKSGLSPVRPGCSSDCGLAPSGSTTAHVETSYVHPPPPLASTTHKGRITRSWETILIWIAACRPNLHEILPIDIKAHRGAIVCGNSSTPSFLVARFSSAEGSYSINTPRSSCDLYKTVIDARFQNVKMDLERNPNYRGTLVQHGKAVLKCLGVDTANSELNYPSFFQRWSDQKRHEAQYKTEDVYARTQARAFEAVHDYAVVETIFEAPKLDMSYYWDEPGKVPMIIQKGGPEALELHDIGSGALAPQYGIDLVVHAGTLRYGPWADRQRIELQRLFFPPSYGVAEPTAPLKPGERRTYTELKVFVELRDVTTFHVPFKEPSKDWQFDEAKFPGSMRKRRERGWLEIHTGGNSTITYILPWVATADGYNTLAELHLDQVSTLSSVNDIQILAAESSRILCEIPAPLAWNGPRRWTFDVSLRKATFHVIRDHLNLLTDLGKDWSSGTPVDFDLWIPMHYVVNFSLRGFEFNLFLNDHNIISHPHARDANTLLGLRGAILQSRVEIPLNVFRPEHTTIPFCAEVPDVDFSLTLPKWNTHATFATSRTTDFARVGLMKVNASFLYHSITRLKHIDQLKLDGLCREVVFISFGWVVRHLMTVRDNYFGNFTHFSTLSEYVAKRRLNKPAGDPIELKWREGKSNVFEVSLGVAFEDSMVVMPAGLPGYEFSLDHPTEVQQGPIAEQKGLGMCVIIRQPELQVYLRSHDYSMEMSLNISPVVASLVEDVVHSLSYGSYYFLGRQNIRIDGINIVANRLFGPQPRTSTYLCMWEIHVGTISGVASTRELRGLSAALAAFRLNFSDIVNAPAKEFVPSPEPDVTFLKATLESMDFAWTTGQASIYFALPHGINFDYNNLPGKRHKKLSEVRIKRGLIRALMRYASVGDTWLEAGSIDFDVIMGIYVSPDHWRDKAQTQMKFVATQDSLTRRVWFLYQNSPTLNGPRPPPAHGFPIFLPQPRLPQQNAVGVAFHPQDPNSIWQKAGMPPVTETIRKSDSDEDEDISEARRDARLAHSRPATPLLFNQDYEDRSISSLDESDDDDVTTDISGSDSEVPEDDESNTKGTNDQPPNLTQYKGVVRRFESHLQDQSISRSSSLFSLVRDVMPTDKPLSRRTPRLPFTDFDEEAASSLPRNDGSSTVRLIRSSSIDVLLTPLLSHVVRQASDEVFGLITSMEMMVDSLTTMYLDNVFSQKNSNNFSDTFDIEVSTFRLRILQSIIAADSTWESSSLVPSPSNIPLVSMRRSRIISDVTVSLLDLGSTFTQKRGIDARSIPSSLALRGACSRFTAGLTTSTAHAYPRKNRVRRATPHFTVVIEESVVAVTSGSVSLRLGDMHVRLLEETSPAMVAATGDSLMSIIRISLDSYRTRATQSATRKQGMLWGILESCRDLHVGDPLAQIQPSLLVQVGCPFHLRLDPSWKLFMYLRHCLRQLNPLYRRVLQKQSSVPQSLTSVQMDQLYSMLATQLQEWGSELEREEIKGLLFLNYCFDVSKNHADQRGRHLSSFSLHSGTFFFVIIQHRPSADDNLGNKISIGPLCITYCRRGEEKALLALQDVSGSALPPNNPVLERPKTSRHHIFAAAVENITVAIHPTFIVFLQHLLQLHGRYARRGSPNSSASPSYVGLQSFLAPLDCLDMFLRISKVSVQAAVESMILEGGFGQTNLILTLLPKNVQPRSQHFKQRERSFSFLLKLSRFYTRVRQLQDKINPFRLESRDILSSLEFSSVVLHINDRILGEHPPVIKGLFTFGSVNISVPRSALLTYRLIEEWRTQYLQNIHSMTQDLLADLDKRIQAEPSPRRPRKPTQHVVSPNFDFQVSVKRVGVSLQVMHGTWFSWDVHEIIVLLRNAPEARQNIGLFFGVQLASQLIQIGAELIEDGGTGKTVKLALPSFGLSGNYNGLRLRSHAIIDHISLTLRPRYMDDILAVQQNLGAHFYDILDLVAESRKNRPMSKKAAAITVKYDLAFMLRGFRMGIVGPAAILDLTSTQMTGTARNDGGLSWDFAVSDLALALSHHSSKPRPQSEFDRRLRSAYMVLDLKASSSQKSLVSRISSSHILRLQIGRTHAVMSPNSVGELGDLIDYFQAEMLLRKEQRANELEEIKKKTKRVMSTFKVEKPAASLKRSTSLLDNRTVLLSISDIGIAFPSALRDEMEVDTIGSVPAFLMSIQKATFSMKRHESGQASLGHLSFQFVEKFDKSHPNQFDGDKHKSRNRLLYPGIKAEFQSSTSAVARRWRIDAHIGGFVLDLDPSIVDNVFGLMDVYHIGRKRVERLTAIPEARRFTSEDAPPASVEASYLAVRTSNIFLTLVFQTGKVRLRDIQTDGDFMYPRPGPGPEPLGTSRPQVVVGELDDGDADVIYFPMITVWGEYRATPAASKLPLSQDQDPSILVFRSHLHTINNQINPTIFPFLTGITQKIEERLRLPESDRVVSQGASYASPEPPSPERHEFLTRGVLGGIQLSFSLSIDSSRLELVCGHNLGVVASLHWESGGFVITLSPRTHVAHFAGSIDCLQMDLRHVKHQGGMVQAGHMDARNLAFSVSYCQTEDENNTLSHSISVVVDTEFGATLRLDRLQDILIFKAIYIDRLPGTAPQPSVKASTPEQGAQDHARKLTTLILFRARRIKLMADLGHNVAAAVVDLETMVLRTRFTESMTDAALSIAQTSFDLEDDRPLAGHMRFPDFSFTTVRRNDIRLQVLDDVSKMLDVALTSGILDIVLQFERRTILQYHAKPFDIRIADNWSAINRNLLPEERTLRLDFSVVGSEVLAIANLQTIPKIIVLLAKLRNDVHVQQAEARKTLAMSYITQLPKPDNTLLEAADAMIRSTRSKLTDESVFSYVIVQQMTLKLSNLRFALLKTPNDIEMAIFQGNGVNAELQRVVRGQDIPPTRTLKLAFSALNLSKYSSLKYRTAEDDLMAVSWLERLLKGASEATIARVPAMNLEMNSDIEYEGRQEILLYDLIATADDSAQSSRGIYVSLNLSLYIWAGALVKGLGVEIEKAMSATEFGKPVSRAVSTDIVSPPSVPAFGEDISRGRHIEAGTATPAHTPQPTSTATASKSGTNLPGPSRGYELEARLPRKYKARTETFIDYGTIQQLGEATPDAKAPWLGLKETVPPRVHEYATLPMEVLMKMLLEVYSKQLQMATKKRPNIEASASGQLGEGDFLD